MWKNKKHVASAYLKHLTWHKLGNYFLLWASFHWSRWVKKPVLWGMPTTLSIEPTTSCNLRCPECPSGLRSFSRPTGMIDIDLFNSAINQSKKHLSYLHLYFQGEPYLHPGFLEMVKTSDRAGIFTSTSTNAHYLNEENVNQTLKSGLKQLIVSMDGISQDVYQQYRIGGSLQKVQKGLSLLLQKRHDSGQAYPRITLQFLVTGQNEHQIPELHQWAEEIGVDEVELKTTQIYNFENGSPLIPNDEKYSRYVRTKEGKWKLKKKQENKCWRMWQGAVLTWDGKLVPCCFDKDASHSMGNLQDKPLAMIWKSRKYQEFRKQLLTDRKQIDICKNCTE